MIDPGKPDRPVFAATIRPHRSLDAKARRLVITLVALAGVAASIPFVVIGAWPVAGWMGLDVLLLGMAFRVNMRQADAFEEVRLTPLELLLRKVSHRGRAREWRFNPAWVRLERREDSEFGLTNLSLVSGGNRVAIAAALSPAERADFAGALEKGLQEARRG
jgi:uncharacterized membrane protein